MEMTSQIPLLKLIQYPTKKFEYMNLYLNICSKKGYYLNYKGIYQNY